MEQQLNKDDISEHTNFTCTSETVTTTDTIDSVDIVKSEHQKPSSSVAQVSEHINCSTLTEVMNIEEKAGYSAQPAPFKVESDLRRKNALHRAPRYFEQRYESDKSSDEDKKRKKQNKGQNWKRCYNCGDIRHSGPECKHLTACLICSKKGHLIKDCPQISIDADNTSRQCLKCGNEGHDMVTCNTEYISEDLKEIQCYVCKDFGHLCCIEYKTDKPTEVSCYKCGKSGHFGSVCLVIEPIAEDPEIFCRKCRKKRLFKRRCSKCNKARKKAVAAAEAAVVAAAAAAAASLEATTEKSAKGKKSRKRSRKEKKAIWPSPVPPFFGPYYGKPGSNIWLNPAIAAVRNGGNKPQYAPLNWIHQSVTETSRQPLNWTFQPVTEASRQPLDWTFQPVTETSRQPMDWTFEPVLEAFRQPPKRTCQPVTETLNWTQQSVTEASQQPLILTCQQVTETSEDPAKPLYPFMHCPCQTSVQMETEFISELVLPKQFSSHQSTVPLPCQKEVEFINEHCSGSPSLSATDPSPSS